MQSLQEYLSRFVKILFAGNYLEVGNYDRYDNNDNNSTYRYDGKSDNTKGDHESLCN